MRDERSFFSAAARMALTTAAVGAGVYAAHAVRTWLRYGHADPPREQERDDLLDRFLPVYDIVERHAIEVPAPAAVTFDAAQHVDLSSHPVVRAIFVAREILLGAQRSIPAARKGLIDEVREIGWGVLAERPGREIVLGAVTRPWETNPTFRAVPADRFAAFDEPDYVKIAWTLRADPSGEQVSVFRTETRAAATDALARDKFRLYWSLLSPGVVLIRQLSLGQVKSAAERAVRQTQHEASISI